MFQLGLAVLGLIAVSAICSMAEAALFSLTPAKAKQRGGITLWLKENIAAVNATIVILNNVTNIAGTILVTFLATSVLSKNPIVLACFPAFMTIAVILFSEIFPKNVGERFPEGVVTLLARPLRIITWLSTPVVAVIGLVVKTVLGPTNGIQTSEGEIKILVEAGPLEADEKKMIHQVFHLNDRTAKDIMTPRTSLSFVRADSSLLDVKQYIADCQHSRILAVGQTIDDVKGVILKSNVLKHLVGLDDDDVKIGSLAEEVLRVEMTTKADDLLALFQKEQVHLAVVANEYNGVAGVVTLEDVLEVITGEIVDETDEVPDLEAVARMKSQEIKKNGRFHIIGLPAKTTLVKE